MCFSSYSYIDNSCLYVDFKKSVKHFTLTETITHLLQTVELKSSWTQLSVSLTGTMYSCIRCMAAVTLTHGLMPNTMGEIQQKALLDALHVPGTWAHDVKTQLREGKGALCLLFQPVKKNYLQWQQHVCFPLFLSRSLIFSQLFVSSVLHCGGSLAALWGYTGIDGELWVISWKKI